MSQLQQSLKWLNDLRRMTSSIQKKDENDKRITRVFISEKGRKVQAQLVEFFNESKEVYFKDMTDGDIETLNRLLTKITENVEQNIEENNNGNLLSKKDCCNEGCK